MCIRDSLIEIAGPIPNDIQRLAYCAYEEADGAIGNDEVNQGMEEAASHSDATYADLFSGRSPGQRRVLPVSYTHLDVYKRQL